MIIETVSFSPATGSHEAGAETAARTQDDPTPLTEAGEHFLKNGAVLLKGVPMSDDDLLVEVCSHFGIVTTEGNGPPPGQLVRDLEWAPGDGPRPALALHTDSAYTEVPHAAIALGCSTPADPGWGDSSLAAVDDVVGQLTEAENGVLRERLVLFTKYRGGRVESQYVSPVLADGPKGLTCRLNTEHLPSLASLDEELAHAVRRLIALLEHACVTLALRPGELLVLDNRRTLHGRTAVAGHSHRRLRRLKMMD